MRKFILLLVIFSSFIANSQVELKPGVKAGLNLSNFTNSNFDVKPDFYAGISLGLKISERYTLQPEVLYSRQGARLQSDGGANSSIEIDYLSLGISNKFILFKGVNLYAVAGPFFDFKVRDNIDYNSLFEFLDKFDVGFFAGLDYEFSSGLGVDFKYKLGLNELNGIGNDTNSTYHNKVFQFGISYNFKF